MTLEVTLNSLGTTVRLIQVNLLAFDGLKQIEPTGSVGADLPLNWFFIPFSPGPGKLNFLAVDLAGIGEPLNGPIFSATFTVDAAAPEGDVLVSVVFADVRDDSNNPLNLALSPGVVTVGP